MDTCEVLDIKALTSRHEPYPVKGDRYDQLRLCVGDDVCQRLNELKLFMVCQPVYLLVSCGVMCEMLCVLLL